MNAFVPLTVVSSEWADFETDEFILNYFEFF